MLTTQWKKNDTIFITILAAGGVARKTHTAGRVFFSVKYLQKTLCPFVVLHLRFYTADRPNFFIRQYFAVLTNLLSRTSDPCLHGIFLKSNCYGLALLLPKYIRRKQQIKTDSLFCFLPK